MLLRCRSLLVATLVMLSTLGTVWAADAAAPGVIPGGSFVDDDGSVHEAEIEAIAAAGITRGCNPPTNDRCCPNTPVTRAQMAAFLVRALDLTPTDATFVDVPDDHTHRADIGALASANITRGCNPPANDRYCPNAPVTRAQMAAFLVRALDLTPTDATFIDVADDHTHRADIGALASANITRGCNPPANDRYCPNTPVTRAQMASFLARALGLDPIAVPERELPVAGNPAGTAPVPVEARAADVSRPDTVIGTGTAGSCTSQAVVEAVAAGGVIVFDCGPDPITIAMHATARVFNDRPNVVIDGGGLVTLSGQGARRILYMNTCDRDLVWTTSHCNDQDHPTLTVQNITLRDGRATGSGTQDGGGAMFVRGGRLKVVNSRFFANRCAATGPDVGGGAVQVFDQHRDLPVYVVNSTFGGRDDLANACSSGGAISSIGVSWTILNSVFADNVALGHGANPARPGTPGGGNGGAIYNDGNEMTLRVEGSRIERNRAPEGGSAIFFVSNNRTGHVVIRDSVLVDNPRGGFETYPGIFFLGAGYTTSGSTIRH